MSTDLGSVDPDSGECLPVPAEPFAPSQQIRVFFDVNTPERATQLGKAVNCNGSNAEQHLGTCMDVIGITIYRRQVSKDGEPVEFGTYLALHLEDGDNCVITAGPGIIAALPVLAAAYGPPPWKEPKGILFTEQRTASGRRRYVLSPGYADPKEL